MLSRAVLTISAECQHPLKTGQGSVDLGQAKMHGWNTEQDVEMVARWLRPRSHEGSHTGGAVDEGAIEFLDATSRARAQQDSS